MRVVTREPLGDAIDMHGSTPGGQRIVARLGSQHMHALGDVVWLLVDSDRLYLFEPGEFGRNVVESRQG
jgi:hypothetical protein